MTEQDLKHRIETDLENLRLPIDEVEICIRPYSKSYYGRYFPVNDKNIKARIFVYPYPYKKIKLMYSYSAILCTVIHEMCHLVQFTSSNFVRYRGVMHNPQFWKLYNRYVDRALDLCIISRRVDR